MICLFYKISFFVSNQMTENAATVEVTQFLTNQKTKLQIEKRQLEKDSSVEKEELERKHQQLDELTRKVQCDKIKRKNILIKPK